MDYKHRDEIGLAKKRRGFDPWEQLDDVVQLAERYKEHLRERNRWINIALEQMRAHHPDKVPPLESICDAALDAASAMVQQTYGVASAMRGNGQGQVIFKETVSTAFKLYEKIFLEDCHHVVAFGGTNLGKTSCSHFLRFIAGPLNAIIRDKGTCVINVYIPRRTVIDMATTSFDSMIALYGLIAIRDKSTGRMMGFKQYHDMVVKTLWAHTVEGKRKDDLNQSRTQEEVVRIAKQARSEGLDLLTEIDEIHYAPKKEGHLGKKIITLDGHDHDQGEDEDEDDGTDENGIGPETLEAVRSATHNVVAFSATPDPNLKGPWTLVKMDYSPIYASTHMFFLGEEIADIQVPVWSFSEFRQHSGIDLSLVDTRVLNGRARPDDRRVRQMYRRVLDGLQWLYQTRPDNRPFNGSLVRLERANVNAAKFADYIERHSDIKVLRYFGAESKDNPREQLAKYIAEGVKFCVVPTGACRMADDLPREVCYLLDFTYRTTYSTALRQSTCGRAGGHGKVSLVVLSDNNALAVLVDNLNKGWPIKNPSQHATLDDKDQRQRVNTRKRNAWYLDLLNTPFAADTIQTIRAELDALFHDKLESGQQGKAKTRIQLRHNLDGVPGVVSDGTSYYFPLDRIFTEERVQAIANAMPIQGDLVLLRPNDLGEDDAQRLAAYNGYIAVSVGTAGRGGKQGNAALGGADYGRRNKVSRQSTSKYANGRRPEILFSHDADGRFSVCNISLPLLKPVTFVEGIIDNGTFTPKDHTWQKEQADRFENVR